MLFDEKNCKKLSVDDLDKIGGGYFYYDYDEGFIYVIDRKGEIVGTDNGGRIHQAFPLR